jgi:hypothetical protein
MLVTKPRGFDVRVDRKFVRSFPGSTFFGAPPQVTETRPLSLTRRSWTDSRTTSESHDDWRRRIADNLNATSTLTGTREEIKYAESSAYSRLNNGYPGPSWYIDETLLRGALIFVDPPNTTLLSFQHANNQALMRFYSDSRQAMTTLQGIVVAGELGQTLRGIKSASNGIYRGLWNYINSLRKGNVLRNLQQWSRGRKTKFVADRWLEFVFGIKPLLSDIDAAAKLLATEKSLLQQYVRVAGFGEDDVASTSAHITGSFWAWSVLFKEVVSVKYYGSIERSAPYAGVPDLSSSGFDSTNWLPSLWELIPYSFVFDYFLNIQHILSSWAFNRALIRWVSMVEHRVVSNETINPRQTISAVYPDARVFIPGYMAHTKSSVHRVALEPSVLDGPTLEFTIPGLSTKWLNLAALFGASRRVQQLIK